MYKSLSCSEGEDKHLLHIALEKKQVNFKGVFWSGLLEALQTQAPPTQVFALCLIRSPLRTVHSQCFTDLPPPSLYCWHLLGQDSLH